MFFKGIFEIILRHEKIKIKFFFKKTIWKHIKNNT